MKHVNFFPPSQIWQQMILSKFERLQQVFSSFLEIITQEEEVCFFMLW